LIFATGDEETRDMITDEQLMERLRNGETDAIKELYERYAKKLYAFCYSITRSEDTEDLVQDVFMRVIMAARSFNPKRASFRTWVFRIARNHCVDFVRRKRKMRLIPIGKSTGRNNDEEATSEVVLADDTVDVEASVVQTSIIDAVRGCIDELENEQEKHAIVLYYIAEKVYREIGEVIGKSTSMAKDRVKSAQEKVKRCLERRGIDSFP
jgi:RNA polymerase sigma-70 factor (ECF subfamily)